MSKTTHTILKQSLEVSFPSRPADTSLPEKLKRVYYGKLLPGLEALFDRHAGSDTLIRIEELSVDSILADEKNWEEELVSSTLHQVELKLRQSARRTVAPEGNTEYPSPPTLPGDDLADLFCYFIRSGRLPWYAGKYSLGDMEKQITLHLEEDGEKNTGFRKALLAMLIGALPGNPSRVQRLIVQYSDRFLGQLFSQSSGYRVLREQLKDLPSGFVTDQRFYFWNAVIRWAVRENSDEQSSAGREETVLQSYLRQFPPAPLEALFSVLPLAALQKMKAAAGSDRPALQTGIEKMGAPRQAGLRRTEEEKAKNTIKPVQSGDIGDVIYVDNAGLVLLHPFLEQLFSELKLAGENGFAGVEAHQRAVLLTQYMVTPQRELPEYELLVNKILCGYPSEETLPATLDITPAEHAEINDLLQTVVDNWKVRGVAVNTTIDNLRVSFLQRPGKLTRRTHDWLLQVEQKGFDIVINSLPWGIGMIKNKWMPEMLRVEWNG